MKTLYLVCQKFDEDEYSINLSLDQNLAKYEDGTYEPKGWEILSEVNAEIVDEFLEDLGFDLDKILEDFYEGRSFLELQVSIPGEKSKPVSTKAFTQFVDNPLMSLV